MARKTVDVEYMKNWANEILKGNEPSMIQFRLGVATTIEEILMRSGNYEGYRLLDYDFESKETGDHSQRFYF